MLYWNIVYKYFTFMNIKERPEGLTIALFFIGLIMFCRTEQTVMDTV